MATSGSGIPKQRRRRDWLKEGECITNGDRYYDSRSKQMEVKFACDNCPVLLECQNYAVVHEAYGYWGGKNEKELKSIRSQTLPLLGLDAVENKWLEPESLLSSKDVAEYEALASASREAKRRNLNKTKVLPGLSQDQIDSLREFQNFELVIDF